VKVNFRSALLGGVLAGFAWQAIGWIFAKFVVTSANYAAIYSSFAVLILFLIWLYLSWLILLIGAEVSYCHQNLKFLSLEEQALQISNRLQEKLALIIMYLIGHNFYNNKERWTLRTLVDYLELPHQHIQDTLMKLENQKLILETGENEPAYIPARSIETIKLSEIIDAARKDKEDRDLSLKEYNSLPEVNVVADKIDDAIQRTLGDDSLKSLINSDRTPN
ncbi:MAG: YihY/virulence factor BrkB family protein, partial [Thermodesulfobacteriota bacterium]